MNCFQNGNELWEDFLETSFRIREHSEGKNRFFKNAGLTMVSGLIDPKLLT